MEAFYLQRTRFELAVEKALKARAAPIPPHCHGHTLVADNFYLRPEFAEQKKQTGEFMICKKFLGFNIAERSKIAFC